MDTTYLDQAIAELELATELEEANTFAHYSHTQREHNEYFKTKEPKVFDKVEYRPCYLIVDNR